MGKRKTCIQFRRRQKVIFRSKSESFVGGLWFRVVRNIRAAGNETRRYRSSEQTIEVDKERRREIIHSELAYVLNIAKYFLFLISRISKKDQRYLSIEH